MLYTKLSNLLFIPHQIKGNHNCWITKQHHFLRGTKTRLYLVRELKTMLYDKKIRFGSV